MIASGSTKRLRARGRSLRRGVESGPPAAGHRRMREHPPDVQGYLALLPMPFETRNRGPAPNIIAATNSLFMLDDGHCGTWENSGRAERHSKFVPKSRRSRKDPVDLCCCRRSSPRFFDRDRFSAEP